MNLAITPTALKSAAPGQYLGYSLQQLRFCYYLMKAPTGDTVSLEREDDVVVYRMDGSHLLEQCKNTIDGNPTRDKSEELWKTFGIWADRCAEGIDVNTTDFVLYTSAKSPGKLALEMHGAATVDTCNAVLGKLKKLALGSCTGWATQIERFLKLGDAKCLKLIERFSLVAHREPPECIRELLRSALSSNLVDDFCAVAIGMARDRADALIRDKKPAIVEAGAFRRAFRAFVRKHDLTSLLLSKQPAPDEAVISTIMDSGMTFVRQLKAIEATRDLTVTAVSDFLRSQADKVDWANDGSIYEDSLTELDEQLVRHHTLLRDEIEDTMASAAEPARGRALYRRCAQTVLPLEGRAVPTHFIAGSYNGLADLRRLGWHPQYSSLFPVDGD